ncbi:DUF3606 domain-containing protein [Kaistella sp. G5-32]|uniref:DUF3606 domain-containing protein n=1 Tax=Kaistella gelatinilytica TaxID=2787636 RepID=A0ABS0FBZ7_9FLAO|nr:DUF3606 domain-containing protein [Kaistella gelatinilytica]MBF8457234.1 DUF3606 domain-containing protein [Kaistella gelatinilytica]
MSDDLNKKRPQDASKINVHETWELSYWSSKFGVTNEQLKMQLRLVGLLQQQLRAI